MPPHQVDEDEHDVQVDHESRGDVRGPGDSSERPSLAGSRTSRTEPGRQQQGGTILRSRFKPQSCLETII